MILGLELPRHGLAGDVHSGHHHGAGAGPAARHDEGEVFRVTHGGDEEVIILRLHRERQAFEPGVVIPDACVFDVAHAPPRRPEEALVNVRLGEARIGAQEGVLGAEGDDDSHRR